MRLSIIIPVFNQLKYTKMCVEYMLKNNQDMDHQLIFVDNGSDQETKEYLKQLQYENKWILTCPKNTGMSWSWNMGGNIARGNILCFLNNDILVPPNFFSVVLKQFEDNPDISGLSPDYTSNHIHKTTVGEWEELVANQVPTVLKREISGDYRMKGFCFFITKHVFEDLNGFDERYGIGWHEDIDFNMRVVQKGYKTTRLKDCLVFHFESKTLFNIENYKDHLERSNIEFQKKWNKEEREDLMSRL